MAVEVKTDHKWKPFRYRYEVPASALEWFDYQDPEEVIDGFFQYRGSWYHLDQFMAVTPDMGAPFNEWDGYASDSYFSGVLIKLSRDGEEYMVGTYIS